MFIFEKEGYINIIKNWLAINSWYHKHGGIGNSVNVGCTLDPSEHETLNRCWFRITFNIEYHRAGNGKWWQQSCDKWHKHSRAQYFMNYRNLPLIFQSHGPGRNNMLSLMFGRWWNTDNTASTRHSANVVLLYGKCHRQFEFSPTRSCVSLTRTITSSEWKLFRFDKMEVSSFQILLVDVTFYLYHV